MEASHSTSAKSGNKFKLNPKQLTGRQLIVGIATHVLLYGGSRSGKTVLFLIAMILRALKTKSRHVIFRQQFKDIRNSIGIETMPWVLETVFPGVRPELNKTDWYYKFPNGSEIWLCGLDDRDSKNASRLENVLGREYSTIWFNECSQMSFTAITTALTRLAENSGLRLKVYYDENPPAKRHWSYVQFIEQKNPEDMTALAEPDNYVSLMMNPKDNIENLPEEYMKILQSLPERKRRRFLEGKFGEDEEGALWNSALISAYRVTPDEVPELVRVVVGVDPSGSSTNKHSKTGIVAAGQGVDGHYYVLRDDSVKGTPLEWGRAVIACYKDHEADRVVGEINYGGEMIESTLRSIDKSVSYKAVHATRGKIVRAEPVSACYEQGLVHHVGEFPDLEDQQVSYTGAKGEESPNELDAAIWCLTELGATGVPQVWGGSLPTDDERDESELQKLLSELPPDEREALLKEVGMA